MSPMNNKFIISREKSVARAKIMFKIVVGNFGEANIVFCSTKYDDTSRERNILDLSGRLPVLLQFWWPWQRYKTLHVGSADNKNFGAADNFTQHNRIVGEEMLMFGLRIFLLQDWLLLTLYTGTQ